MKTMKELVKTPQKALFMALCLIVALAVVGGGTMLAVSAVAEQSSIGKENAQNFAFADAGVDPVSAKQVQTTFEYKQGQFVYEVEFTVGDTEYEYWIKASDGAVVKKEQELVDDKQPPIDITASLSLEEAKQIALKDAQVSATGAVFIKEKLDEENGVPVYEFEFTVDQTEYDYEIDANSGAIVSKSKETTAATPQPSQPGGDLIDLKAAKSAALQDAGVSAADVTYTKTERDDDGGIAIYEIDFYTASHEYEYEIHAQNGNVLSREIKDRPNQKQPTQSKPTDKSDSYIGTKRAKEIALKHAGFQASEVTFSKVKLEHDDGQTVYEIEFDQGGYEYEYTIHAGNGKILEHDVDERD